MIGWRELWKVDPDIEDEDGPAAPNVENAEIDLPETPPKTPRTSDPAISRGHRGNFLKAKNATTSPQTSPTPTSGPSYDPKAFDVLAAHLDAVIACQTSDELADADVTYWRHQLDAMSTPANATTAQALKHCRRIMFEPWVRDAARLGWTERDVWGYAGPRAKAGHGLALGLALATPRDRAKVISITADDAIIETAKGNRISVSRNDAHPPIWTCAG
jgi:hypothetical protein